MKIAVAISYHYDDSEGTYENMDPQDIMTFKSVDQAKKYIQSKYKNKITWKKDPWQMYEEYGDLREYNDNNYDYFHIYVTELK